MIFIIGHKTFDRFWAKRKKRELFCSQAHENDPFIFDGCSSKSSILQKLSNSTTIDSMSPAAKYLKSEEYKKYLDEDASPKKYFKSRPFNDGATLIAATFLRSKGDINIALVIDEKAYKCLGKKYVKYFSKAIGINTKASKKKTNEDDLLELDSILKDGESKNKNSVVYLYNEDLSKKVFTKNPSKDQLLSIKKTVKQKAKELKAPFN